MLVCTSICANYLPKAMILAKTLKEFNPEYKMLVCLSERNLPNEFEGYDYFDYIILAKDIGYGNFDQHIFKHSIVEAATSVKGRLFNYMLSNFPEEERFIYLDPDIRVMGDFSELELVLNSNEIVVTPHICDYEESMEDIIHNELNSLKYGIFNLGFLAIKRGQEASKFIDWWDKRLTLFCYNDIPNGIFTDQKWIDLAPCFFEIHIFKHPGYNYAPWNYSKRKMYLKGKKYYVNEKLLKFVHFSGLDSGANEEVEQNYIKTKDHPICELRKDYLYQQERMGQSTFSKIPWSYDYFKSGEKIRPEARITYRNNIELYSEVNPFEKTNEDILLQKVTILDTLNKIRAYEYLDEQQIGIYIFGTGRGGQVLIEHIKQIDSGNNQGYIVKGFFDNNSKKWGTSFMGLPVFKPTIDNIQQDYIIIASCSYASIMKQQLLDMGITEKKVIVSKRLLQLLLE